MSNLFIAAFIIHEFCDFFLQNQWMADNKTSLLHPASWVHSGIHFLGMLLVFSPGIALIIGLTHILIDTRRPLTWWKKFYGQTTEGPMAIHVAIWQDQVAHWIILFIVCLLITQ